MLCNKSYQHLTILTVMSVRFSRSTLYNQIFVCIYFVCNIGFWRKYIIVVFTLGKQGSSKRGILGGGGGDSTGIKMDTKLFLFQYFINSKVSSYAYCNSDVP